MYVHKVIECKSLLETIFYIKEELLKGETFSTTLRSKISSPEELRHLLGNNYYMWIVDTGVAYSLLIDTYYKDSLFKEIHHLSTEKYFQFIKDNAEKIDKLYKLKSFL
jgi:hypothetical protein